MARSRRPSRRRASEPDSRFERFLAAHKRVESRRGAQWYVQPVSGAQAVKDYICPECGRAVSPGTAHVVTWRADDIRGDAAALADRRHWHTTCWRIA